MFDRKQWLLDHHEELKSYHRNYRISNKECLKEQRKQSLTARNAQRRAHYSTKIEHFRAENKKAGKRTRTRIREAIFEILGSSCVACGFSDKRALEFDHIQGGGGEHRRQYPGGAYHKSILQDPAILDKYQVLCANCNRIKKVVENEV